MTKRHCHNAHVPPLLTPSEVADRLRVSANTVRSLIRSGEIESIRVGRQLRVSEDALSRFITKRTLTAR